MGRPKPQAGRVWKHVLQNSHHMLALILHSLHKYLLLVPARVTGAEELFWITQHGSCVNSLGCMNQKATDNRWQKWLHKLSRADRKSAKTSFFFFSFCCSLEAKNGDAIVMAEPTNLSCSVGRETSALWTVFYNRLEQSVLHISGWHFQKEYILKQKAMVTARIPIPEFLSSLCVWWGETACSRNTSTCQSPSQSSVRCANFLVPEGLLSRNQNQSILSVLKHLLLVSSIKSHTSMEAAWQKRDEGEWREKVLMLTSRI